MRHPLTIVATVWFVFALLGTVFEMDLWKWLFLTVPLVKLSLIGMGAVLALLALRNAMRDRQDRRNARVALTISVLGLVLLVGFRDYLSQNLRFLMSRAHYEKQVAEVLSVMSDSDSKVGGNERDSSSQVAFCWKNGSSTQVAFYWIRGFAGDWVGLVYDSAGEVHNARLRSDVFGPGTHSRHLTGPWYLCWFT